MQDTVGMNRDIRGPKLAGARGEAVAFSQSQEEKNGAATAARGATARPGSVQKDGSNANTRPNKNMALDEKADRPPLFLASTACCYFSLRRFWQMSSF